jgi:hypothetical protein
MKIGNPLQRMIPKQLKIKMNRERLSCPFKPLSENPKERHSTYNDSQLSKCDL